MQHPFLILENEYKQRLASLRVTRKLEAHNRAVRLLQRPEVKQNFQRVFEVTGIPMVWMMCSFERESSMDFSRSPAQGDRWDRVSVNVPRGVGPFKSWVEAAIWSYRHDGIDKNSAPWTMPYACWSWEKFNGFGPRDHGRCSGYVFSGTDQYDPPTGKAGKYVADGVWSGSAVDQQLGCVSLALDFIALDPSLALTGDLLLGSTDPIPVTPVPVGVGGGAHDAAWIQDALNKLNVAGTPLLIDGSYGRRTRNAVREFQRAHGGLTIDGLAGPKTLEALENALKMQLQK